MTKRIYAALVSPVAVVVALLTVGAADASAGRGGLHHHHQQGGVPAAEKKSKRARSARQRARASRRGARRAVAYVCPMHADVRERSRGTCPKCLMELVAEPAGSKASGAGAVTPGGM
ncbi:MAG TPA: heavy metal-binding domain-containing protein [Pyrinomonadaceae bacterium]|jgi:hypothetical protein